MDKHQLEFDLTEREPAYRQPQEQLPVRRQPPPSHTRKRSHRSRWNILPLAISVMALIVAITALFFALRRDQEAEPAPNLPTEDEPVTFRFGDIVLTPIAGMPVNAYDKNAFGLNEKGRVTYEQAGQQAKTGIDVSTHQKEIDWQAVAADGIDFVMIRLGHRGYTEGGLFSDQTFEQNLQGALAAGLEAGVYFFSQAVTPEEAEEEADYILEILDGRELTYPIAFDWEFIAGEEARTNDMDGAMITACAAAFCRRIENAGYRPAVYFNRTQGYLHYDLLALKDYTLWLAEYSTAPDFYYHFDLWQYSSAGQVDGIQGNVDMNLSFGIDAPDGPA